MIADGALIADANDVVKRVAKKGQTKAGVTAVHHQKYEQIFLHSYYQQKQSVFARMRA